MVYFISTIPYLHLYLLISVDLPDFNYLSQSIHYLYLYLYVKHLTAIFDVTHFISIRHF